jgi:hypothetical protein
MPALWNLLNLLYVLLMTWASRSLSKRMRATDTMLSEHLRGR